MKTSKKSKEKMTLPVQEVLATANIDQNGLESPVDTLTTFMAGLGFERRTPSKAKGTLEFAKFYSDLGGRVANVVSVIALDSIGYAPKAVQTAYITIQLAVSPDEIETTCPAFARSDLASLNAYLAAAIPSQDTSNERECTSCGNLTVQYILNGSAVTCGDCVSRHVRTNTKSK